MEKSKNIYILKNFNFFLQKYLEILKFLIPKIALKTPEITFT